MKVVAAPAKINLHLRVGPRRDDGFHPLLTWMTTIGLFDKLELQRVPSGSRSGEFTLRSNRPDLPNDSSNLVIRAAAAIADIARQAGEGPGEEREEMSAFLDKRIPLGAGLGGGSSDAAAALLALNEVWHLNLSQRDLSKIAATLGSDVPFFLHGPSSICTGRGENVRPIAPPAAKFALLVLPQIALSTAEVYRRFDEMNLGDDRAIADEPPFEQWTELAAEQLLPRLVNDLEPAAFDVSPPLAASQNELQQTLTRPVRMSGSGSGLFTLFDSRDEAESAARKLTGTDFRVVDVAPV